jgi:hypothetical protein
MQYYIIPAALVITLIVTLLISIFSRRPLSGLWVFFFIVFLATWAGQLWITPFGPVLWGVAWVPLLIITVFFWLFILALLPPLPPSQANPPVDEVAGSSAVMGLFLWIILIILVLSIIAGYFRLPAVR